MKRKYNNGPSFDFSTMFAGLFIIGIAVWKIAVAEGTMQTSLAILLLIPGFIIFPGLRYNMIDSEKRLLTRYINLLLIKIPYARRDLSKVEKVGLSRYASTMNFYHKSLSGTANTRSFDVFFELGPERLIVEETTDYEEAVQVMDELAESLQLPAENYFEKLMESLQRNRRR